MSATNAIENLNLRGLSVTCRRCKHMYNDEDHQPRLLPCLHDVCLDCLCELVFDEILICPECKLSHETPDNDVTLFPKDPMKMAQTSQNAEALTEVFCDFCDQEPKASHRCMDCLDNLCSECLAIHKKYKKYRSHDIVSMEEYAKLQQHHVKTASKCTAPGHSNEEMKFFCSDKDCERCLCSLCVISHIEENHRVLKIDTVFENRLRNIKAIEADLLHQSENVDAAIETIKDEINNVDKMSEEALRDANVTYNHVIKQLEQRKSDVKKFIQSERERKKMTLTEQQKGFLMGKHAIDDGRSYLKNILESGNKLEFLNLERLIREQFLRLANENHQCIPCINPIIRFSSFNMLEELEERINVLGTVVFSNAYASYTKMKIPSSTHVGETFEVSIQLFDQYKKVIQEDDLDIQICLVDPVGKLTRSLYPCQEKDGGVLNTSFRVEVVGIFCVEVLLLGRPFYIHNQSLDISERSISPVDGRWIHSRLACKIVCRFIHRSIVS